MNTIRKIIISIFLFTCISLTILAQGTTKAAYPGSNNVNTILPRLSTLQPIEPTTASLGRYGEYKMNNSTGQPDISIPLYEIKSGDLTIPLTLSYQSGGIKVAQEATWVGLGWDLFYGGQVTRVVRGFPDETEASASQRPSYESVRAIMDKNLKDVDNYHLKLLSSHDAQNSFMPDEYYYNIGMENGKFIGREVEAMIPYKATRINSIDPDRANITNTRGDRFFFEENEITTTQKAEHDYPAYTSAWYISRIVSANNNVIRYEYQKDGDYTNTNLGYSEGYYYNYIEEGNPTFGDILNSNTHIPLKGVGISLKVTSKKPRYIYFNGGRIVFEISARSDISTNFGLYPEIKKLDKITIEVLSSDNVYTPLKYIHFSYSYNNNRLILNSVFEQSITGETKIIAEFGYNQTPLPAKNSFSYDFCGYSNGADNSTPIPLYNIGEKGIKTIGGADKNVNEFASQAGTLSSIKYPSGGKTVFTWENHRYNDNKPIYTYTDMKSVSINAGRPNLDCQTPLPPPSPYEEENPPGPTHTVYISSYVEQKIRISGSLRKNITTNLAHNKYDQAIIEITDVSKGGILFRKMIDYIGYSDIDDYIYLRANNSYIFSVTANCSNIIDASLSFSYNAYNPNKDIFNYPYAGLRIKEISNYGSDGILIDKDVYTYVEPDLPGRSSGYITNTAPIFTETTPPIKVQQITESGSDSNQMGLTCHNQYTKTIFIYDNPSVGIYPNNISYRYVQVRKEKPDKTNNGVVKYEYKTSYDSYYGKDMPMITHADERGQLLKQSVYNDKGILLEETKHYYKEHPAINKESRGFRLVKYYDISSMCYSNSLSLDYMYVPTDYTYSSVWLKTDSVVKHSYTDPQNWIKSKTEYKYDDILSCLPTKVTESTSIAKSNRITNYLYPSQLTDAVSRQMTEKNILSEFIQKEELTDTYFMARQINKYSIKPFEVGTSFEERSLNKELACLDSVQIQKGTKPALTKIKVPLYNRFNNILQYETDAGLTVSCLWGYNYKYPVAEIKNLTYPEIVQKLGQPLIDRVATAIIPDPADLQKINDLRASFPKAQVTTYTYQPLVGLLSMTDSTGKTIYYGYDMFNRLKENYIIENGIKKILQASEYHYQK